MAEPYVRPSMHIAQVVTYTQQRSMEFSCIAKSASLFAAAEALVIEDKRNNVSDSQHTSKAGTKSCIIEQKSNRLLARKLSLLAYCYCAAKVRKSQSMHQKKQTVPPPTTAATLLTTARTPPPTTTAACCKSLTVNVPYTSDMSASDISHNASNIGTSDTHFARSACTYLNSLLYKAFCSATNKIKHVYNVQTIGAFVAKRNKLYPEVVHDANTRRLVAPRTAPTGAVMSRECTDRSWTVTVYVMQIYVDNLVMCSTQQAEALLGHHSQIQQKSRGVLLRTNNKQHPSSSHARLTPTLRLELIVLPCIFIAVSRQRLPR
eukprot:11370-Heterococcus_DN1.PRE.7